MTIEHDYFGLLGSDDEGEIYWSDTAELGDQSVDIDVTSPDEASVAAESLDIAAGMINAIEELDSQVRESLVADLSADGSMTSQYIEQTLDDMDPGAVDDAIIWDSGDRQIDFLRSIQLQRITFMPHNNGVDERFALMEYSISPDDTDYVLMVTIDVHGDTLAVAMES
ncbi:DUF2004 domain-containing protein [Leifsonia sp. A12D58]|uniref:DUF2004 domain-containing protein n=1 Tax=Leifsonia sp. A12D58 TaxID=3397674 RepID=UPI0039E03BBD